MGNKLVQGKMTGGGPSDHPHLYRLNKLAQEIMNRDSPVDHSRLYRLIKLAQEIMNRDSPVDHSRLYRLIKLAQETTNRDSPVDHSRLHRLLRLAQEIMKRVPRTSPPEQGLVRELMNGSGSGPLPSGAGGLWFYDQYGFLSEVTELEYFIHD